MGLIDRFRRNNGREQIVNNGNQNNNIGQINNNVFQINVFDIFGAKNTFNISDTNRNQFFNIKQSIEMECSKIVPRMRMLEQQMAPVMGKLNILTNRYNNKEINRDQYTIENYQISSSIYDAQIEYMNLKYYYAQNTNFLAYLNGRSAKISSDYNINNEYE